MGWWTRWFGRPAAPAPSVDVAEVKREIHRMEIREAQHVAERRQVLAERDRLWSEGKACTDPVRRRGLARRYLEAGARAHRIEDALTRVGKEMLALTRIRIGLEQARTPGNPLLERFSEADACQLDALMIDDRVTEEMYRARLDQLLGQTDAACVAPTAPQPAGASDLREEDILAKWESE